MRRLYYDDEGHRAIVTNDYGCIHVKGRYGTRTVDGHRNQDRVKVWLLKHHFHRVYAIPALIDEV